MRPTVIRVPMEPQKIVLGSSLSRADLLGRIEMESGAPGDAPPGRSTSFNIDSSRIPEAQFHTRVLLPLTAY